MKNLYGLLGLLSAVTLNVAAGDFAVEKTADNYRIQYRGKPLIEAVTTTIGDKAFGDHPEFSETTLPDGRKAFNVWSRTPETRFRQEIVLSPNAEEVEITFLTERTSGCGPTARQLTVAVPWSQVAGLSYHGLTGRTTNVKPLSGTIAGDLPDNRSLVPGVAFRQLALSDGKDFQLVFDCNPLGVGDFLSDYSGNSIRGLWGIYRHGDRLELVAGDNLTNQGGHVGGKLRIYAGTAADYGRYHAQTKSGSGDELAPLRLYNFGAEQRGKNYTSADTTVAGTANDGWIDAAGLRRIAGGFPGAYYSAVAGRDREFQLNRLTPGVYILTIGCGNYTGEPNRFDISCNGKPLAGDLSIAPRQAVVVTVPVRIENDSAILKFQGDFLISTLGLQFLLADKEDYSFRRGIWAVDGFEPSVMYRNAHYRPDPVFTASVERLFLPEPGKEQPAPLKALSYPVAVETEPPASMDWRYHARFSTLGGDNASSINEYTDPAALDQRLQELQSNHINAIMVNGMLSRHTYPAHADRAVAELKKIADAAHQRNMKVMDHHDLTLLWNIDSGYRVMCERIGETDRRLADQLPTPHFCLINPVHRKYAMQFFVDFIRRTGIDAIMIDEVRFGEYGCGCAACREKFHDDTGWYLPVNELDPRLNNREDPLWKCFLEWHKQQVGNWWVDLRREVKKIRPDFSFLAYSTHYGFSNYWAPLGMGSDLFQFARGVDFLGTEIMSRNVLESHRAVIPYRKMMNLLQYAYQTPIFGLVYPVGDWDVAYFGWAANNMNGQLTWETVLPCPPGKSDYHTFAPENMDLAVARPAAEAALLFSSQSRDWNRGFGFRPELMGTAQTLEELHIPYQMIGEMSLNAKGLQPFRLLFLGASGCLSDLQLATIKQFARDGGAVIVSPLAGIFDEMGNTRPHWGFADVFGFDFNFTKLNIAKVSTLYTAAEDQVPVETKQPYYRPDQFAATAGPNQWAAEYGGRKMPAVTVVPYGRGKFIFHHIPFGAALAAAEYTPGEKYQFALDPQLAQFYRALLRSEFSGADAGFTTDAPAEVYTSLYTQNDAAVVHFLNASGATIKTGEVMRNGAPKVPFPPLKQDIRFTVRRDRVAEVYAVSPDFQERKKLDFQFADGHCSVTLPKEYLKAYTLVFIR